VNPVSQFVAIALALTFSVVAVLLWTMLRKPKPGRTEAPDEDNARIYREELQELRDAVQSGALAPADFERARQDLSIRVVQDIPETAQATTTAPAPSGQRATISAVFLALVFPLLGAFAYLTLGDPMAVVQPSMAARAGNEGTPDFAAMAEELKAKLKTNPNDAPSWVLLGRAHRNQNQYDEAIDAYNHAVALDPDDRLAIERAEVIAAKNGGQFAGEPWDVIRRILAKNPQHANALLLAGSAAFSEGQFKQALAYWTTLRSQLADGSQEAVAVDNALRAAAEKAGVELVSKDKKKPDPLANAASSISGRVTISDSIKAQANPTDVVFIYAHAEQGSPMPLAIMRTTVQALPLDFNLNDSMAMRPEAKLSGQSHVTVKARISKSGQAMPQPGDLIGTLQHVAVGAKQVRLTISEVVN
jgi:cytochrome c-type biogenesis protein CcmH